MAGAPAAGAYFPQVIASDAARLDDILGPDMWLISRNALDQGPTAPFAADLRAWLDRHAAEAVLVRPDRHVFGTGKPDELRHRWQAAIGQASASR